MIAFPAFLSARPLLDDARVVLRHPDRVRVAEEVR